MITSLLIWLKHHCPWLWTAVEGVNSLLCRLRYGRRLKTTAASHAAAIGTPGYTWSLVSPDDAEALSAFLETLPADSLRWFKPHPFTPTALRRMASGLSFVMFKVSDAQSRIVGYNFLRLFFIGKAFHGLAVGTECRGQGLGRHMWALGAEVCAEAGIRMHATVSLDNLPSLHSCRRATRCTEVRRLPGGFIEVECLPRHD